MVCTSYVLVNDSKRKWFMRFRWSPFALSLKFTLFYWKFQNISYIYIEIFFIKVLVIVYCLIRCEVNKKESSCEACDLSSHFLHVSSLTHFACYVSRILSLGWNKKAWWFIGPSVIQLFHFNLESYLHCLIFK